MYYSLEVTCTTLPTTHLLKILALQPSKINSLNSCLLIIVTKNESCPCELPRRGLQTDFVRHTNNHQFKMVSLRVP